MKTTEKKRAMELRKQGKSYNEIVQEVSVSKSTLSLWLQDINLTKAQLENMTKRLQRNGIESGKKLVEIWEAKRAEIKDAYIPPMDDPEFMLGIGLYWGEGSKHSPHTVGMSNSDLWLLKKFVSWVKKFFSREQQVFSGSTPLFSS